MKSIMVEGIVPLGKRNAVRSFVGRQAGLDLNLKTIERVAVKTH